MKNLSSKTILVSSLALILTSILGCQTQTKEDPNVEKTPTFSISSGQSDTTKCEVAGEMKNCNVYWSVNSGILTHRQVCTPENLKYTPLVLNAMAKSLKDSCPLSITYVRMTSKDDVLSEKRLARMISQSKIWKSYTNAPPHQRQKFSNAFVKKVVDAKGLFNDVANALNQTGYKFKLSQTEVADLSPIQQSRHFNSLRAIKTDKLLVPENVRLVWLDTRYLPKKTKAKDSAPERKSSQIPTVLPDKKTM